MANDLMADPRSLVRIIPYNPKNLGNISGIAGGAIAAVLSTVPQVAAAVLVTEALETPYSKYKIDSFSYPINIMQEEYGGNYVMFNINVQSESKIGKFGAADNFVADAVLGVNQVTGQKISAKAVAGIQGAIGAGQGAIANKLLGAIGIETSSLLSSIIGGATRAIATGIVANETGGFNQPVKRIKTGIALHMPLALSVKYSVNYEEADIGLSYRGAQAMGENTKGTVSAGAAALAMQGAGDASGMISKISKTAVNPVKEQVFKSVDFRTFSFTYTFAPKDSQEAANCLNIIHQFKYHMHPEFKDEDQFLYIYPSEFDITYYNNNQPNDNIHHHTSCVLMDLSLDYAPQGTFSTFPDGTPTQIVMSLLFKELGKLDKDNIKKDKF